MHPVKLHVVTGFLGSGKTTLLRRLLEEGLAGERVIVLVNELGEVGIDGALLRRGGHEVVEFTSGCMCCQLGPEVVASTLDMIQQYQPDRILIELTGVAEPGRVLSAYSHSDEIMARARIEPTICVVDAEAFPRLHAELEYAYYCQIQASDIVLLNKADLVPGPACDGDWPLALAEVRDAVRELSPRAFIHPCVRCRVDLEGLFAVERAETDPAGVPTQAPHGERLFETRVLRDPESVFDRARVEAWLQTLPATLFRLKGTVRLAAGAFFLNWVRGHHEWEPAALGDPEPTVLVLIGRGVDMAACQEGLVICRRRKGRGVRLAPAVVRGGSSD